MAPRTENPMPAAMSVKKLAQNRIFSLSPGPDPGWDRLSAVTADSEWEEGAGIVRRSYPWFLRSV
jgi:hypothetical protein